MREVLPGKNDREEPVEERREGCVSDDAAQKRGGIHEHLERRKELPWMRLQLEDERSPSVSVIRKRLQSRLGCRSERDFRRRKKGAEQHKAEERRNLRQGIHKHFRKILVQRGPHESRDARSHRDS